MPVISMQYSADVKISRFTGEIEELNAWIPQRVTVIQANYNDTDAHQFASIAIHPTTLPVYFEYEYDTSRHSIISIWQEGLLFNARFELVAFPQDFGMPLLFKLIVFRQQKIVFSVMPHSVIPVHATYLDNIVKNTSKLVIGVMAHAVDEDGTIAKYYLEITYDVLADQTSFDK